MSELKAMPLFNTPIVLENLSLNQEEENNLENFIKTQKFEKANQGLDEILDTNKSSQGEDLFVLEKSEMWFMKNKILDVFDRYKNEVMRYENTDFKLTTSWFTKTEYGEKSDYHNHANCMFSAVFYINQSDDTESGNITFTKHESRRFNIKPVEFNLFNSEVWTFNPNKHDLIIFPSETYHRVKTHMLKESRYSLAMNFMPVGNIGSFDSILDIKC